MGKNAMKTGAERTIAWFLAMSGILAIPWQAQPKVAISGLQCCQIEAQCCQFAVARLPTPSGKWQPPSRALNTNGALEAYSIFLSLKTEHGKTRASVCCLASLRTIRRPETLST